MTRRRRVPPPLLLQALLLLLLALSSLGRVGAAVGLEEARSLGRRQVATGTAAWVADSASRIAARIGVLGDALSPRIQVQKAFDDAHQAANSNRTNNITAGPSSSAGPPSSSATLRQRAEASMLALLKRVEASLATQDGYAKAIADKGQQISEALHAGDFDYIQSLGDVGEYFDTSDPARRVPGLRFDPRFKQDVSDVAGTVKLSPAAETAKEVDDVRVARHIRALRELDSVFRQNDPKSDRSDLKWQYFATAETGMAQFYPGRVWGLNPQGSAKDYFPRYRPWFSDAAAGPKDVMILLDHSGSMQTNGRLEAAKEAIDTILETLTPRDFVNVLAFADRGNTASVLDCASDRLVPATRAVLSKLRAGVANVEPAGDTDFTNAFEMGLNMMNRSSAAGLTSGCQKFILFLTDGISSDPTRVIDSYNRGAQPLGVRVFAYTIGEQVDPEIPTRVACNNRGTMTRIREVSDEPGGGKVRQSMMQYFNYIGTGTPRWSAPYLSISLGVMVTRTYPIYNKNDGKLFGVAAIDVTITEAKDQVLNWFESGLFPDGTYAFIVSGDGTAVVHPLATIFDSPPANDISELEMVDGANSAFETRVRPRFLSRQPGSVDIDMPRRIRRGAVGQGVDIVVEPTTYIFSPVPGTDFVLVVRMPSTVESQDFELSEGATSTVFSDRLYHRLAAYTDGGSNTTASALQARWASLGPPVVAPNGVVNAVRDYPAYQVPARAFCAAGKYLLSATESAEESLAIIDFVNNATTSNSSNCSNASGWLLKNSMRAEVHVLIEAVQAHVQAAGLRLNRNTSALWTYVGSRNGATVVWPGADLEYGRADKSYDCADRPWYASTASWHRRKDSMGGSNSSSGGPTFTLTGPYEDAAGSGYVVTMSAPILDPGDGELLAGVAGVDFEVKTLQNHLNGEILSSWNVLRSSSAPGEVPAHNCSAIYDCPESPDGVCQVRCFLVDSAGFILFNFSDPTGPLTYAESTAFGELEPSAAQAFFDGGILTEERWHDFNSGCDKSPSSSSPVPTEEETSRASRLVPLWARVSRASSGRKPPHRQQSSRYTGGVLAPQGPGQKSDCNLERVTFQFDTELFGASGAARLAELRTEGLGERVSLTTTGSRSVAYVAFSTDCEQGRAYVSQVARTNTFLIVLEDYWSNPARTQIIDGEFVDCPTVGPSVKELGIDTCLSRPIRESSTPACVPFPDSGFPCSGKCEKDCSGNGDCVNGECICDSEYLGKSDCSAEENEEAGSSVPILDLSLIVLGSVCIALCVGCFIYRRVTVVFHRRHLRENRVAARQYFDEVDEVLAKADIFKSIVETSAGRAFITGLASLVELRTYEKGDIVIKQGDEGDEMFIIAAGSLRVEVNGVIVTIMQKGALVGELAVVFTQPRAASLIAESTEVRLLSLHKNDLEKEYRRNAKLRSKVEEQAEFMLAEAAATKSLAAMNGVSGCSSDTSSDSTDVNNTSNSSKISRGRSCSDVSSSSFSDSDQSSSVLTESSDFGSP